MEDTVHLSHDRFELDRLLGGFLRRLVKGCREEVLKDGFMYSVGNVIIFRCVLFVVLS